MRIEYEKNVNRIQLGYRQLYPYKAYTDVPVCLGKEQPGSPG